MIKTPRLALYPLKVDELELLQQSSTALAQRKGWMPVELVLESGLAQQLADSIPHWLTMLAHRPAAYRWCSPWAIVLRQERRMIGILGFDGPPNAAGECAVGYGIDLRYHGQGFMTEALVAALRWAERDGQLVRVKAETSRYNYASQQVLRKVGFRTMQDAHTAHTLVWSKEKQKRALWYRRA